MNDEVLVRVEGVSKKFCRSLKKSLWYGMQDLGNELRGRRHGGDGELRRGACLGMTGCNGAGKPFRYGRRASRFGLAADVLGGGVTPDKANKAAQPLFG